MKRHDKILYRILGILLLVSSAASFFFFFTGRGVDGLTLEVQTDDEIIERIVLSEAREARILEISRDIGYNAYAVGAEGVRMVSADCRGGDCLRMPAIGASGGVIVCLPHKVILRLINPSRGRGRVDGVSY